MIDNLTTTIKKLPKAVREMTVEIAALDAEACFKKALRRLTQVLEIEGFRKGKVPPDMAEKYIRTDALFEEALHIAVEETYPEAVKRNNIEPIGRPEVDVTKIARGEPMSYKVRVAVLEEAELPNWRKIQVKRKAVAIGDEEVEKALDYLQKSRVKYVAATHPARKGDFVEIDFTIRMAGVIIEGGNAQKHPFVLGEGKFIPGFEEQIEGMGVAEEKIFSLTFPESYHEKAYAGREVSCTVKLVTLFDRVLPDRDDAFAQSLGDSKTFEELKKNVRDGMQKEKEEQEASHARLEAVTAIAQKAKVEIPAVLTDREVEKMFQDLEERITGMGMTLESYLDHLKKSRADLAEDWKPEAAGRVRIALTLRAIGKSESIAIPEEKIEERMREIEKSFFSGKDAGRQYTKESLREYAQSVLMNEEVFKLVEKECVIS